MTQPDPADQRPPVMPSIRDDLKDVAKGTVRELGLLALHVIGGSLVALVGLVLVVASVLTGSTLLRYAGVTVLVVGVFWVVIAWNTAGIPRV